MRVDEFSMQTLRESHATIQELTSQIQELQERENCMSDSTECQDVASICSGRLSHVPSQPAGVPSPRTMLSHDLSMPPHTWNLSIPRRIFDSSQMLYQGILHNESKCHMWDSSAEKFRETCRES